MTLSHSQHIHSSQKPISPVLIPGKFKLRKLNWADYLKKGLFTRFQMLACLCSSKASSSFRRGLQMAGLNSTLVLKTWTLVYSPNLQKQIFSNRRPIYVELLEGVPCYTMCREKHQRQSASEHLLVEESLNTLGFFGLEKRWLKEREEKLTGHSRYTRKTICRLCYMWTEDSK